MKRLLQMLCIMLLVNTAQAQITFKDIDPDAVLYSGSYSIQMHPSVTGAIDINFVTTPPGLITLTCLGDYEVRWPAPPSSTGYVLKNKELNSTGNWVKANKDTLSYGGHIGYWLWELDAYLAVRFKMNGKWHYGWVRMGIDMKPTYFDVKEWAYNTTPEAPIITGSLDPVGIENVSNLNTIQPIVTKGAINIIGLTEQQYKATLTDMNGRILQQRTITSTANSINTSQYTTGIYLLRMSNNISSKTFKINL